MEGLSCDFLKVADWVPLPVHSICWFGELSFYHFSMTSLNFLEEIYSDCFWISKRTEVDQKALHAIHQTQAYNNQGQNVEPLYKECRGIWNLDLDEKYRPSSALTCPALFEHL